MDKVHYNTSDTWNTYEYSRSATASRLQESLAAGADVNESDKDGWTPLHWAALVEADATFVRGLIDAGADVNMQNRHGKTPLHIAASHCEKPVLHNILLDAGADISIKDNDGFTAANGIICGYGWLADTDTYRRMRVPEAKADQDGQRELFL